jgi:Spy/CpxP family protein refolding chaperone
MQMEMTMIAVARTRAVLVSLIGVALASAALAQSSSSPQQSVAPRGGAGPWAGRPGFGMMGGWGDGPGMMGYGAGRGMMRGYGYGMGPGAMMPDAWAGGLDLSDEQRAKIHQIQDETRKRHWALMGSMMDQQAKLRDLYEAPQRDNAAIDSTYQAIEGMRQQMIDSSAEAHKRIEAVLTKKQLEQLRTLQNQQDQLGW